MPYSQDSSFGFAKIRLTPIRSPYPQAFRKNDLLLAEDFPYAKPQCAAGFPDKGCPYRQLDTVRRLRKIAVLFYRGGFQPKHRGNTAAASTAFPVSEGSETPVLRTLLWKIQDSSSQK